MLSTLLVPTSGYIYIDNIDALKYSYKVKRNLSLVSGGERMLYYKLTARENLEYFGRLYNLSYQELKVKIEQLLSFVRLEEKADQVVETFSQGMRQRLQIARGLINDPKYIFMDEPTLGLDYSISHEIRKSIKILAEQQGKGILLTSHYLQDIEALCDYLYLIDNGQIIFEGTQEDLINSCGNPEFWKIGLLKEQYNEEIKSTIFKDNVELMNNGIIELTLNSKEEKERFLLSFKNLNSLCYIKKERMTLEQTLLKIINFTD